MWTEVYIFQNSRFLRGEIASQSNLNLLWFLQSWENFYFKCKGWWLLQTILKQVRRSNLLPREVSHKSKKSCFFVNFTSELLTKQKGAIENPNWFVLWKVQEVASWGQYRSTHMNGWTLNVLEEDFLSVNKRLSNFTMDRLASFGSKTCFMSWFMVLKPGFFKDSMSILFLWMAHLLSGG